MKVTFNTEPRDMTREEYERLSYSEDGSEPKPDDYVPPLQVGIADNCSSVAYCEDCKTLFTRVRPVTKMTHQCAHSGGPVELSTMFVCFVKDHGFSGYLYREHISMRLAANKDATRVGVFPSGEAE